MLKAYESGTDLDMELILDSMSYRLNTNGKTRMKAIKENIRETVNLLIPFPIRILIELYK